MSTHGQWMLLRAEFSTDHVFLPVADMEVAVRSKDGAIVCEQVVWVVDPSDLDGLRARAQAYGRETGAARVVVVALDREGGDV